MGRRVSPGKGEDQTRQAVPLPSRSTTVTLLTLSVAGTLVRWVGALQPFPDWLK
jgi:hypothetical protein